MSFLKSSLAVIATTGSIMLSLPAFAEGLPGEGKSIQPIATGQTGHIFQHAIVQIGLERLGYEVEDSLEAQYPPMHLAIAEGDADYTAIHWDRLHIPIYEQAGGDEKLIRIGTLTPNGTQGYFIDKATSEKYGITNLGQFTDPAVRAIFDTDGDGKADLTGCESGWGCELVIEHQLDAFKLRDSISHNQGSYYALIADTITRYKAGNPIFYFTWSPLWVGSVLKTGKDVVQLNVPFSSLPGNETANTEQPDGSNSGFELNNIRIVANRKFAEENPAAARFFELVTVPIEDVNAELLTEYESEADRAQIYENAEAWIAAHQEQFDSWIAEATKAGQ
ncbi:glycine betaine/L-proline ABC transporter substrate-binding protein ProX [Albidovulum sediminis]|uniref:Glycine betaine/L-proline ABC transporter substrate-binding protein ProX n=1 Tax=Albidovulum sediminis TaxID=3066345 RepID=A0ABT2NRM4_9RHOB|nr:glycine betaine/L-proline ABC transporter substrate-binding protein ProX [Defluviimonas sediminis]MCT8331593.1 glycine betaine/L-proline ABC transporter substrate-binding protein ProX [Defluviimonas sediminis]